MKEKKYKLELVICHSYDDKFSPETEDGCCVIKNGYKYYFCDNCSTQKKHLIVANSHPVLAVPGKVIIKYRKSSNH